MRLAERGKSRSAGLLVAALALIGLAGAGPEGVRDGEPEVVQLRAPAAKAVGFFPEGSQLRLLPFPEFEDLLHHARLGAQSLSRHGAPRQIRASHTARWEDGVLVGRSELVIQGPAAPPSALPLSPWSPAIDPSGTQLEVRTSPEGRNDLWIEHAGQFTTTVAWKLRARPGTRGRVFDLALPDTVLSRLSLDLPEGQRPLVSNGLRAEPETAGNPGRRVWVFHGRGGSYDVRIRDEQTDEATAERPNAWIHGPTAIEVHGASATWKADWTVDLSAVAPRQLRFELDPGLRPIGVSGPDVAGFSTEADGKATRLTVELAVSGGGSTRVQMEALARVPDAGPWKVPAARPLSASWTGGRTRLHIGPVRIVESCHELAGIQVPPAGEEAEGTNGNAPPPLVFEAREPRSVAEIVFRKPAMEATAEVRGILQLGRAAPWLEATVTWKVLRGPALALPIDLPAGWSPDQVQILGIDEPTAWRIAWRDDGGPRVIVQPPAYLDLANPIQVALVATASAGWSASVEAPRVLPGEARVSDELWVARGEPGGEIRPIESKGLVWVEPSQVAVEPSRPNSDATLPPPSLAWRWIEPEGRLRIERVEPMPRLVGECWTVASVDPERLRQDWYLALSGEAWGRRTITLHINRPLDEAPEWHVLGDEIGPPLGFRRVAERINDEPGFPEGGSTWELDLPAMPETGRLVLHARQERPWSGEGSLPLFALPAWELGRGAALIFTERSLRPIAIQKGLLPSDRNALRRAFGIAMSVGAEGAGEPGATRRLSHAFEFGPSAGRLDLKTEPLQRAASDGVILEARLRGATDPDETGLRRLVLQLVPGTSRCLTVELPAGGVLVRAFSDKRPIVPIREGKSLRFALPMGPSRPFCELVLEYELAREGDSQEARRSSEWPTFSVPCLALTREIPMPRTREVVRVEPTLRTTDPAKWARVAQPGPFFRPWPGLGDRDEARQNAALLRELRARFRKNEAADSTLGECLTRLDAGTWPLVIDRAALATAGIGPGTRLESSISPSDRDRELDAMLARLGLAAVPIGGAILITTPNDAPDLTSSDERMAWIQAIHQAAARGYDETDRLQSVARWRGGLMAESPASTDRRDLAEGWQSDRWVALGEPAGRLKVGVLDENLLWSLAWTSALLALAFGIALRRLPARGRAVGLATVAALGLLAIGFGAGWHATLGSGLFVGGFAASAFWLGMAFRNRRGEEPRGRSSNSRQRAIAAGSGTVGLTILVAILILDPFRTRLAAQERGALGSQPILAVLPYEEGPDLGGKPDKVLLRLSDYERLEALARSKPTGASEGPWTVEARHEIKRLGDRQAEVVSDYQIRTGPVESSGLLIPLGNAREIKTWVDGREVHVRIVPGASHADLRLPADGLHRLRVQRLAPILPGGLLQLPILPAATAKLEVELGGDRSRVEVPGAFGPIEETEAGVVGLLGPSPAIEVRWSRGPEAGPVAKGTVEGLFLWDLKPAGDRIRARLTYRNPSGTSRIQLELEPGLVVRSASFPGWSEARWAGTAERPVWDAPISPPLADGGTVVLEFWRTRGDVSTDGHESRTLPRIVPLGVEAHSGVVAVRLPELWSSRFEPAAIADPILEDLFLRSWGPIPDARAALVGAVNWARSEEVRAQIAPAVPRPTIQPTIHLELSPGRADLRVEARCVEESGRLRELRVGIPPLLRVLRVEADGLGSWSREEPDRLLLRFEAMGTRERNIRIEGWLPAELVSRSTGQATLELPLPWLSWPGSVVETGQLAVSAPPTAPFRVEDSRGLAAVRAPGPDETAAIRALYRVTNPEPSAVIRWPGAAPRADVTLRSHLTFHPQSVEWVALVRYQVSGGPSRSIRLDLPTEWAEVVEVRVGRGKADIQREPNGDRTVLKITPDPPIWATCEILLRARRPWKSDGLNVPDLTPLGYGRVSGALLAWVDLSGRMLTAEGSAGLQQVDPMRFMIPGLPVPDPADRKVYQVLRDRWSLRVRAAGDRARDGNDQETRRVRLADVVCNLADDGSVNGLVRYQLASGQEPFLTLRVPPGLTPLAATVDGASVVPWLHPEGDLLIPLGEGSPSRVTLVWKSLGKGRTISWPRPAGSGFPTLVTVHARPGIRVSGDGGPFAEAVGSSLEVERLEQQTRGLLDSLAHFDRSSPRERAALLSGLVQAELQSRSAARMARGNLGEGPDMLPGLRNRLLGRIQSSDALRSRALREAGLESFLQTARARVGLDSGEDASKVAEPAEVPPDLRLRWLGRPSYFLGHAEPGTDDPPLHWSSGDEPGPSPSSDRGSWKAILAAFLVLPLAFVGLAWRRYPIRLGLLGLPLSAAFPALGLAPVSLAFAIGSFGLGYCAGGRPSESSE